MNEIYVLSHTHKFECGHEDSKLLGIFYSYKRALDLAEMYKSLQGFRDFPDGFCIQKYVIDTVNNEVIKVLRDSKSIKE